MQLVVDKDLVIQVAALDGAANGYQDNQLADIRKGVFLPDEVASDIGVRLRELRVLLGMTQVEFARKFGRGWKQASSWERGHQKPHLSLLKWAASANGWPEVIFLEGGPRPADALKRHGEPRTGVKAGQIPPEIEKALKRAVDMATAYLERLSEKHPAGIPIEEAEYALERVATVALELLRSTRPPKAE